MHSSLSLQSSRLHLKEIPVDQHFDNRERFTLQSDRLRKDYRVGHVGIHVTVGAALQCPPVRKPDNFVELAALELTINLRDGNDCISLESAEATSAGPGIEVPRI